MDTPFSYLEVGPGHGLMVYFASQSPLASRIEAWDVSEVSLSHTRAALDLLGAGKPVSLVATDVMEARPSRIYDLVVISEVLEHLERPDLALRSLRKAVAPAGRLFVNVPLNSPSPDHIFLFSTPDEVRELVEGAGFVVDELELFATQGRPIASALRQRVSISAGVVARPAAAA
jgi:2-polyprenyl-3-methyl-5-hydroxy-6-metoxy-1,4-benzoquinol methylase